MGKIFIHIGIHKTGTTFLQKHYFPQLKDITYDPFTRSFMNFSRFPYNEDALISNEGLSGRPWNLQWLQGKKNNFNWLDSFKTSIFNLKIFFPNAHIIIFYRNPGELLLSLYKQYIQEGGVLKFDQFYCDEGVISDRELNFEERLKFLKANFSKVDVLSYEIFKLKGIDYLNQYFISYGYSEVLLNEIKRENISIAGKKIELLRQINKYYSLTPGTVKYILNLLRFTPRFIIQKKLKFWKTKDSEDWIKFVEEVNNKFRSDIQYVETNLWSGRRVL